VVVRKIVHGRWLGKEKGGLPDWVNAPPDLSEGHP